MKRTRELYEELKEIAGDTWVEPTFIHDTFIGDNHGLFFFPDDEPERSMEFHHTIGENYEKGLDVWIDKDNPDEHAVYRENGEMVGYLRVWGSKPNTTRNTEKYPELETHMSGGEEGWTLRESWEWLVDKEER